MSTSYPQKVAVRFGEFELDHSGELGSGGRKIKLQEQPLQILRILMERSGEIVTREELQKRIWPSDTFVDFDHGINNAIKRLREALGDTAETPRCIEILP
jgi:DNA-binding winged helix-turn-helix (wHTH) protein